MGKMNSEWKRTLKFVLFSISAGIIDALSYTLCNELFGLEHWISQIISLTLSVIWNFTFNRRFTFQSAGNVPIAMLKVAAFYALFTPVTAWLTHYWTEVLQWNEYVIKALTMLANLVLEFLYQKYFVFKDSIDTNELAKKSENAAKRS